MAFVFDGSLIWEREMGVAESGYGDWSSVCSDGCLVGRQGDESVTVRCPILSAIGGAKVCQAYLGKQAVCKI